MSLPFTFDQLEVFTLVLDTGSFSAAAEQLGVSQPAISAQVRELERKVGVRLIERVGRTIAPTAAGVTLSGHARMLLETGLQAAEAVAHHTEGVQGTVRIGTGATACLHLLPPVLQGIRSAYPGLHVIVKTGNTDDIVRRVELNALDLGLVTLPISSRALTVSSVLRDSFVAVCANSAAPLPKTVSAKDLADLPLVMFEPGTNTRELVDAWLLAGGVRSRPTMELGSIEAIKEMVAAGLGTSVVPEMALRAADRKTLQVRALRPALSRGLGIVMRQDKPLTRGMQVLVKAILGARSKDMPLK
ncbi:LysR family transcriptional regulator [Acidovorax sp. CCYZU-2555]|uniref:LysR family transcriptional regulator n=1 Tax=Acidovorax sp. CCYZU-2555 TaxID=2835042 RepID=UPI001BCE6E3A|nr:LysR family transcriptional regulator [Acidovorax sp. CCYZU-2555]MBS7779454.1 LysR family transcriptional regulator [Acidovorax sp. CCYZU-2555]